MNKITYFLSTALLCTAAATLSAQECDHDLYIGSYQEDPLTNKEDPMPGALRLMVPREEKGFNGELYFTYIGCQSSNIGSVTGDKKLTENGTELTGNWQGVVDNTNQSGGFDGKLNRKGFYEGTYTVSGGKQRVSIEDCIEYYIAPKGTWFIFPVNVSVNEESITVSEKSIKWDSPQSAAVTQCQLVDLGSEESCGDDSSVLWQNVVPSGNESLQLTNIKFVSGHKYAAACSHYDNRRQMVSFNKRVFIYPDMMKEVK